MQLAFARVKESWDEAYLTNMATQTVPRAVERIRSAEKVGMFTTDEVSPAVIAKALLEQGIDYFTAYICENLGSRDERVTRGSLQEISKQTFASLNVMILLRMPNVPDRPANLQGKRLFGNPDECFMQSRPKRGLLTPSEVRAIALAELDLGPQSVVWDVGAGSGSVAIESALLSPDGRIFAIEMAAEDYNLLIENSRKFGTNNVIPILGEAPEAWRDLPDPDAIFVGGTGRAVVKLVEEAWSRLRTGGRLVANVASVENVTGVEHLLRQLTNDSKVLMINLSRSQQQFEELRFESANPSFLVVGRTVRVARQQRAVALFFLELAVAFVGLAPLLFFFRGAFRSRHRGADLAYQRPAGRNLPLLAKSGFCPIAVTLLIWGMCLKAVLYYTIALF